MCLVILNFIVKGEGLLKVTSSHVHWKSGNISETVIDRDVVSLHYIMKFLTWPK